jgi:hypothetical protein
LQLLKEKKLLEECAQVHVREIDNCFVVAAAEREEVAGGAFS